MRSATEGALLAVCGHADLGAQAFAGQLLAPPPASRQKDDRAWLGRLGLLKRLLLHSGAELALSWSQDVLVRYLTNSLGGG